MGTNTKTGVRESGGIEEECGAGGGGNSNFQHQTNILSGTMKNVFEQLLE